MTATTTAPVRLSCSFCRRNQGDVDCLIAGPDVFICDACVGLCQNILDDHRRQADQSSESAPE